MDGFVGEVYFVDVWYVDGVFFIDVLGCGDVVFVVNVDGDFVIE